MSRARKTYDDVLSGRSDPNINFGDLCQLLKSLGFLERIRGSHHLFHGDGVEELLNLQRDASKAKAYQVR